MGFYSEFLQPRVEEYLQGRLPDEQRYALGLHSVAMAELWAHPDWVDETESHDGTNTHQVWRVRIPKYPQESLTFVRSLQLEEHKDENYYPIDAPVDLRIIQKTNQELFGVDTRITREILFRSFMQAAPGILGLARVKVPSAKLVSASELREWQGSGQPQEIQKKRFDATTQNEARIILLSALAHIGDNGPL